MRLLHVHTLEFQEFHRDAPKYVAASHRWSLGNEAMIGDVKSKQNVGKSGYRKVEGFAKYIREHIGYIDWLWIDTCCVNQDSSQEVNEAVNSMFRWYSAAEMCIAYLEDVHSARDEGELWRSEWFRRGWTLQELLAPTIVIFLSKYWRVIGYKGEDRQRTNRIEAIKYPRLDSIIAKITLIPYHVLRDYSQSKRLTVEERLAWTTDRATTKPEDMYYSLLGIFDVAMPVLYGEGLERARRRLLTAITDANQLSQFATIATWLSPPDPWVNHHAARRNHEPHTGSWLLQSNLYQDWRSGRTTHLWLHGKAGCGKTILCSTVIEDIRRYCKYMTNTGFSLFYFSFSDGRKQSYEALLLSLVAQLGWREPAQSMLRLIYDAQERIIPDPEKQEEILLSAIRQYHEVFLFLDALDECPEENEARQSLFDCLFRLSQNARNLKIFATSRRLLDIKDFMDILKASSISIDNHATNADIETYVHSTLVHDRKLSKLPDSIKRTIMQTFSQKADGMFRWAFCQLQELRKLKSTKPRRLEEALQSLPHTLDDTYERMLTQIENADRRDALTMLRWLAFEHRPLTLAEITEVCIIDPSEHGIVEIDNRGGLEDVLEILTGLVMIHREDDNIKRPMAYSQTTGFEGADVRNTGYERLGASTRIRLAHFSVKEYLVSSRILEGTAKDFHLQENREHRFIAQSCLKYLLYYSSSRLKASTKQDLKTFPLLDYAASSWFYHSSLQQPNEISREVRLLTSKKSKQDWLMVYQLDDQWWEQFGTPSYSADESDISSLGSDLYCACALELEVVARALIAAGADVDAQGGFYRNALQVASDRGCKVIVEMLLDQGANINAQGGFHGNALQAATYRGHQTTVEILLDRGSNVNAQGGFYGSALQTASGRGYAKIVKILLDRGADIDVQGGFFEHALHAASDGGYQNIMEILIDRGADVNAQGGGFGYILQDASHRGYEKIVELLLDKGADINAQSGPYRDALQAASSRGHEMIVETLLDRGANIDVQGGFYGNALQLAAQGGYARIVWILLERGAEITLREDRMRMRHGLQYRESSRRRWSW